MTQAAADRVAAVKVEMVEPGCISSSDFGTSAVRETAKPSAPGPWTGERVLGKAGATAKFKASPALKEAA